MGCVTVGPPNLDSECCFDVEEMHEKRNKQKDHGCLLLSRFHCNCCPQERVV